MTRGSDRRMTWSQNYLRSPRLAAELVAKTGVTSGDIVVEIGPGQGQITRALAETGATVMAVEIDARNVGKLQRSCQSSPNVVVFESDFMAFPTPATPYRVVANIPYRISTAIVAKLTTGVAPPADTWLVVQRETAERFCGTPVTTMWSVNLYPWFMATVEHRFARRDFMPVPAVDSVLLRLARRESPLIGWNDRERFEDFTAFVFAAWKPTFREAVVALVGSKRARRVLDEVLGGVDAKVSATEAAVFVAVYRALTALNDPAVWRRSHEAGAKLRAQQAGLQKRTRSGVGR